MKEFIVVLSSGTEYILASDSEHAAWQALELATDRDAQLIDVRPYVNFDW
jgi:hypothetical protein